MQWTTEKVPVWVTMNSAARNIPVQVFVNILYLYF